MNGFRPLTIFQNILLIVSDEDGGLSSTLESEPNLVRESYFSENYDLSNFIGQ